MVSVLAIILFVLKEWPGAVWSGIFVEEVGMGGRKKLTAF